MRLLMAVLFCIPLRVVGQSGDTSTLFPPHRHTELRQEVVYEQPEVEEPITPEFDPIELFNFSRPAVWLISVAVLLGLGLLIYRILGDIERRRNQEERSTEAGVALTEIVEEEMVEEGVSEALYERAEQAGQYDIAVRLLYIALLKSLHDAGMIRYRKDYSNRDYRRQLGGKPVLDDFVAVTRAYERYWYGKHPIDRLSYRVVKADFQRLGQRIDSSPSPQSIDRV